MATIKDIANAAGVSVATVSHVVNNTRFVSPELRKRVEEAIANAETPPNFVVKKKMQEKQNKENNDPGDTVIWGVNGEQRPSEEAVKEIYRYLKKSGHDFKVKFTRVLESDTDK